MKLNLSLPLDVERFCTRANALIEKGAYVELIDKSGRTRAQNSYDHLLIGIVAMELGESIPYVKEMYFKRLINPDIFVYRRHDPFMGEIEDTYSTREISKEQTSIAIDRFKRWMAEQGIYAPSPMDEARLKDIEIEMGRMERYIGR